MYLLFNRFIKKYLFDMTKHIWNSFTYRFNRFLFCFFHSPSYQIFDLISRFDYFFRKLNFKFNIFFILKINFLIIFFLFLRFFNLRRLFNFLGFLLLRYFILGFIYFSLFVHVFVFFLTLFMKFLIMNYLDKYYFTFVFKIFFVTNLITYNTIISGTF